MPLTHRTFRKPRLSWVQTPHLSPNIAYGWEPSLEPFSRRACQKLLVWATLRYFVYAVDELKYNSGELLQKSSRRRNELSSGTLNPTMSNLPIPAMLIWINYTQHPLRWLNDQQAFESNCRPTGAVIHSTDIEGPKIGVTWPRLVRAANALYGVSQ